MRFTSGKYNESQRDRSLLAKRREKLFFFSFFFSHDIYTEVHCSGGETF